MDSNGAFADACSACSSPVGYSPSIQSVDNAHFAYPQSMHGGRLASESNRMKSVPSERLADIVQGSIALASSLSISPSGPSPDFKPPNLGGLVPVPLGPRIAPLSSPVPAAAAADRTCRSSRLNLPHSPIVAPALQLFTTPAAAASVAAGMRGAQDLPGQRLVQGQRFAYISPGDSARSEVSTVTDMVCEVHTD